MIHCISLPPGEFGTGRVIDFFTAHLDTDFHPYFREISDLKVSSHFFIERDGSIFQFVEPEDVAWHAGESAYMGREDCNRFSIGIELEGDLHHPFTEAQYHNLAGICRKLMKQFPTILPDRIVGHMDVAPGRKVDPGPLFDWKEFSKRLLAEKQIEWKEQIGPPMEKGPGKARLDRGKIGSLIGQMTLDEKVAQLLVVGFDGTELDDEMEHLVRQGGLGGVILFGKNCPDPPSVHHLCRSLQGAASSSRNRIPILICLDQEGGKVVRIKRGMTLFPGNADLGRIGSFRTTETVAGITARELRALGIQLNLAPVADVNENQSPESVIGARSFGETPKVVASMVRAWCRGSQESGVAACAKHFPGHGAVREDSHFGLPRCKKELAEIERIHLPPFKAAIRIPVAGVMIGHLLFECIDSVKPASLSEKVVTGLLRRELGFGGVCISDDMDMTAISENFDPIETSCQAWAAGVDLVLFGRNIKKSVEVLDLIKELVAVIRRRGEIEFKLDLALRRVLFLKAAYQPVISTTEEDLQGLLRKKNALRYAHHVAQRSKQAVEDN